MSTVDEILATERYTDRRGTLWQTAGVGRGVYWFKGGWSIRLTEARMRLLIERDHHRNECVGLRDCYAHPAPRVFFRDGGWSVIAPGWDVWSDSRHIEFADAWDAARALAVKP